MNLDPFSSYEEYEKAVEKLSQAAKLYYAETGDVEMTDYEYDELRSRKERTELINPTWVSEAGSKLSTHVAGGQSEGGDVVHSTPMLSLDNAMDEAEFVAWYERFAKVLNTTDDIALVVEPKLDGLALVANYENGKLMQVAKRGDGYSGESVIDRVKNTIGLPETLSEPLTIEVRGECIMTREQYLKANEKRLEGGGKIYQNARNAVAGVLSTIHVKYEVQLTFAAYAFVGSTGISHSEDMKRLRELGFETAGHIAGVENSVYGVKQAIEVINRIEELRATLGFEIDGAVIKADLKAQQTQAGSTGKAPRWAIARKYAPDTAITLLENIDFKVGRTGAVTPRAVLKPVFVGGTTIKYATLHNEDQIQQKGLRIGDEVLIHRAGEVIPEIVGRYGDHPENSVEFKMPTVCPNCGTTLDNSKQILRCPNAEECSLERILEYFVSRKCLDIEGLGSAGVVRLVEQGLVNSVADLYTLTEDQLADLDLDEEEGKIRKLGATRAKKIVAEIEKSKSQPLSKVFCGLGVRYTGERMSKRLAKHFLTMDALRSATVEQLSQVEGMGDVKPAAVQKQLVKLGPVIDRLAMLGVNMIEPTTQVVDTDSRFEGKTVVVSGTVPGMSRPEAQEWVEKHGGKTASSVSKNTSLLIAGDGAGSKVAKANSLGVEVMDATEFAQIVATYQ